MFFSHALSYGEFLTQSKTATTLIPASLREPVVAFGLEDTQEEHYGAPILATCEHYRLAGYSFLSDKMLIIQAKRHQTFRKT